MQSIEVRFVSSNSSPDRAFDLIADFANYTNLVDEVKSVHVRSHQAGHFVSDWEVVFRNGPLCWSEVDYVRHDLRRIVFEQTTGDFQTLRGLWSVMPTSTGCEIVFEVAFDFGGSSLAGALEPIAAKFLKVSVAVVVLRLLGDATVVGDLTTQSAATERLRLAKAHSASLAS